MNPFGNRKTFLDNLAKLRPNNSKKVEEEQVLECKQCKAKLSSESVKASQWVCPMCGYYFPVFGKKRLAGVFDGGKFKELFANTATVNPLSFPNYDDKIKKLQADTGLKEAIVCGVGEIGGERCVVGVMDTRYLMGSMGTATGEKIARTFEYAIKTKLPVVLFTASGGARMQEGIFSLFQMAKTSAVLKAHSDAGLLYVVVLTNPTTGGVTASFASLGDIIIAEPGALIGFAGPRVIEQTIGEKLPEGFQTAEYVQDCGFIDIISPRREIRKTLAKILKIHSKGAK